MKKKTFKSILEDHDAHTDELELDLLRYFEKTRGDIAERHLEKLKRKIQREVEEFGECPAQVTLAFIENVRLKHQ